MLTPINALRIYHRGCGKMEKDESILKQILYRLYKYSLYLVVTVVTVVIFLLVYISYENKRFINRCMNEGYSLEHCQAVCAEINALD